MTGTVPADNGRLLVKLDTKMDAVLETLTRIEGQQRDDHDRIGKMESIALNNQQDITTLGARVDRSDARDKLWGGFNSAAAVIAGLVGSLFGGGTRP